MTDDKDHIIHIKNRIYFSVIDIPASIKVLNAATIDYLSIAELDLEYEPFFKDFGPLNLCKLYHFCQQLNERASGRGSDKRKIIVHTKSNQSNRIQKDRVNAAYLIGSYSLIYLEMTVDEIYKKLTGRFVPWYVEYVDASMCGNDNKISLLDCLSAIQKARNCHMFDFTDFNAIEYEHYERVENGDLNWILPGKFIAFCGPHERGRIDANGYIYHTPEKYFKYFRTNRVTTIVRLNSDAYNAQHFIQKGFAHRELYFVDGGTPSDEIMEAFLVTCEQSSGAIAVHCKAGLGRTGTLIACYLMKHYRFTATEAIAWCRICRPGSVIGDQQKWLQEKQQYLWQDGRNYRRKHNLKTLPHHRYGIYSIKEKTVRSVDTTDTVSDVKNGNLVDQMSESCDKMEKLNLISERNGRTTQGDTLNRIKALRATRPSGDTVKPEQARRIRTRSVPFRELRTTQQPVQQQQQQIHSFYQTGSLRTVSSPFKSSTINGPYRNDVGSIRRRNMKMLLTNGRESVSGKPVVKETVSLTTITKEPVYQTRSVNRLQDDGGNRKTTGHYHTRSTILQRMRTEANNNNVVDEGKVSGVSVTGVTNRSQGSGDKRLDPSDMRPRHARDSDKSSIPIRHRRQHTTDGCRHAIVNDCFVKLYDSDLDMNQYIRNYQRRYGDPNRKGGKRSLSTARVEREQLTKLCRRTTDRIRTNGTRKLTIDAANNNNNNIVSDRKEVEPTTDNNANVVNVIGDQRRSKKSTTTKLNDNSTKFRKR